MRPPIVVFLFALMALAVASHRADAFQHVANGGFEQGFASWSIAPGTDAGVAALPEVDPAEGSASARVVLGGASSVLRQRTQGALPSGAYSLTVQARSSSASTLVVAVLPADANQQIVVADTDVVPQWDEIGGTFSLISAAEVIVSLTASGPPGAIVYLDDVRLDGAAPVTLTPTPVATSTNTPADPLADGTAAPSPVTSPTATATIAAVFDVIAPVLRNGGFETIDAAGLPFAWEKFGGVLSSNGPSRSGARAARLESATTATKWLHQAVTVQPYDWYAFDAWIMHNDPAVASAFLRVSWYGTGDASGASIEASDSTARLQSPVAGYRHLTTGAIQAPADARSARVRVMLAPSSAAPASITVDDVSWSETSPPPTPSATPIVAPASDLPSDDGAVDDAESRASRRAANVLGAQTRVDLNAQIDGGRSSVVINEVLYDADVDDVPDADAEWVELYNRGDAAVDVTGWSLRDATSVDVLPALSVPARGFAIIAATDTFHSSYPNVAAPVVIIGGRIGNALGNDGDRLYLVDAGGNVVDAVSWGDDASALDPGIDDVPAGHSIERLMAGVDRDRADDFVDNERPAPGASYEAGRAEPDPRNDTARLDVLAGSADRDWDWLPWALVGMSAALCAGTLGWRTFWVVRERVRHP